MTPRATPNPTQKAAPRGASKTTINAIPKAVDTRRRAKDPSELGAKVLVALDNPWPSRDYEITCTTPELTCLCPVTGQPDFATVTLSYVPDRSIVELKSLKLYLWSYRQKGMHHEDITNRILQDLVDLLAPRRMTVTTLWNVRGGITTQVTASHP